MDEADAGEHLAWLYVTGPQKYRDPNKALPLSQRAADLAPSAFQKLLTLGVVQYRLGDYHDAVKTLTRAAGLARAGPTPYDQFFLAMSYHRSGETVEARKCFERALVWRKEQTRLPEVRVELLKSLEVEAEEILRK
jgi:Flp pilus assembly protein TadD